ncbi:MAG: SIMPL domain-containing protein [bacterium]
MNEFLNEMRKRQLFGAVMAVVILLAVFLGIKSINSLKEYSYIGKGVYSTNVITVSGKGEVTAIPDVAEFTFTVTENAKTVKDAQDLESKKVNSAIDAIKAMGVAEKDIKTESYNSYPKYEYQNAKCPTPIELQTYQSAPSPTLDSAPIYCPSGKSVLTGYEVSQTISVKVRKTDTAGDILTKIGSLSVANISGLNFVVDDMDAVQAQARDKAIADAKQKAAVLSKSLGIRLSKITSFYESGNGQIYYSGKMMSDSVMGAGEVAPAPQLPTGENKITSNVTITYEVN